MLQSISIRNFILIEKLDLDFADGFCVITGETGAGKSILIDAILFALGGKFPGDIICKSKDYCSVSLVLTPQAELKKHFEDSGIDIDDELVVKRTLNNSGRKKFYINDQIVSQKIIQKLFSLCFEIHGQHNHTALLEPAMHLKILDEYGKLSDQRKKVTKSYNNWQKIEQDIDFTSREKDNINREIDYLSHICDELQKAEIEPNEEANLADLKHKIQNQSKEADLLKSILANIEESGVSKAVISSQRNIARALSSESLQQINDNLEMIFDKVEDTKSILQNMLHNINDPRQTLEEIEDRLYEIRSLARKHSCMPTELNQLLEVSKEKLQKLQNQITNNYELIKKAREANKKYFDNARELSLMRKQSASGLEKKIMSELKYLQMQKSTFKIDVISSESDFSAKGIDKVRFLASTNPGMPEHPIDKIASGGELSRFMLALLTTLLSKGIKSTIIFDEIDVGISGAVSDFVGERLQKLGKNTQTIAITHQAQIAGKADWHIIASKTQHDSHTNVEFDVLNNDGKSKELARMISGRKITNSGIKAAKELMTS